MNLYIDFDGVIVDTIDVTYKMIREINLDFKDDDKIKEFYANLNWYNLLNNINQINNSIDNIKKLQNSNLYNLSILTTVHSNDEIFAKKDYIKKHNLNIPLISVPSGIDKANIVDARGAILVDDFSRNLYAWEKAGGIGIKFSNEESDTFPTIKSLDELNNESFVKKLVRHR